MVDKRCLAGHKNTVWTMDERGDSREVTRWWTALPLWPWTIYEGLDSRAKKEGVDVGERMVDCVASAWPPTTHGLDQTKESTWMTR